MVANAATATTASTSVLAVRLIERLPRRRVRLIPGPSRGRFPLRVPPVRQSRPAWPDDPTHGRRAVGILGEIAIDRYRHCESAPPGVSRVRIRDAHSSGLAPADNPKHERAVAEAQYRKRRAGLFERHENRLRFRIVGLLRTSPWASPRRPGTARPPFPRPGPSHASSLYRAAPRSTLVRVRSENGAGLSPGAAPACSRQSATQARSCRSVLQRVLRMTSSTTSPGLTPPAATAVCLTLSPGPAPSLRPDRRRRALRRREVEAGGRRASRASRRSAAARHRNGVRPCPPTFPKRTAAPSRR